ncbi:hypothetical protein ANCCAN_12252 [Ancylostoma caninum]|uniref:SCP domain-containing protein n=1 Tax=Ancylostoma caninum TaxID=29170 RepID=A0A368GBI7_ANCCA|nr:hypothetical protein ANCCAN_12252 [Ancylostoma caninum]
MLPYNYEFIPTYADPSCDTPGLNPELRQKILEFHKEKAKSLDWDCELEKKAHESIKYNEVDTSGIGGRVNEYAEMSIGTMEVNVKEALRYWFEKNPYYARENVDGKFCKCEDWLHLQSRSAAHSLHLCIRLSYTTMPFTRCDSIRYRR